MRTALTQWTVVAAMLVNCSPRPKPAAVPQQSVAVAPDVPAGNDAAQDAALAQKASGIVDAFVNSEPLYTRDRKKLVFVSNRDGLPQLYIVDATKTSAAPARLLSWPDRMTNAIVTPDGKSLIFQSDHGADELWSFYRVNLATKEVVELTPGEKLNRDQAILPDGTSDTLFFSARKMTAPASMIYATPATAAGTARIIYTDEKPGFLTDVSNDGKQGLFVRYPSQSENYLLLVDLATGTAKNIFPASGARVTIFDARFSPDGKRIYVATDGGGEQGLLLALDDTGQEIARYTETNPATAMIGDLAVAKKGGAIAIWVNAGNRNEVRLLDGKTLQPRGRVKMPLGSGAIGKFTEDGKRLTVFWSTPATPGDVFAVDAKNGQVTALRKETRPSLEGLGPVEVSIVEIDAFDGGKIPINVYVPPAVPGSVLRPVIVSYHGGPSHWSAVRWSPIARFFLGLGYVWVEPNVRGSGGFGRAFEAADNGPKRLDAFRDIETSARWAASQPWADKDRVIVAGGSYGGYTVLVALTRWPEIWRAGVNLFGVVNLKTFMATTSGLIREIFLVEFGDPAKDAAFLDSISPIRDVKKISDPLFVYAGANDPRVPRAESDQIVRAMRNSKIPVEYMVKDNEGHSLARRENQIELMSRSARFLETHAK